MQGGGSGTPGGVAGALSLHPLCPTGGDIIAAILAHLPAPGRTRRQVVKQLVRMGLASSAKDFQQERWGRDPRGQDRDPWGQGRDPWGQDRDSSLSGAGTHCCFPPCRKGTRIVLWTQEQEEELTRLFEEFQGSDGELDAGGSSLKPPVAPQPDPPPTDVLGNIMKHLTARRSRARVVEKLLGLGLVAERKELFKKRRRKGHGPGPGQVRGAGGSWAVPWGCCPILGAPKHGVSPSRAPKHRWFPQAAMSVPAVPAQDSLGEDEDSEEEEEEDEDEAEEGPMEEHWVPEEGAGQDLAQHLHQEGG